MNLNNRYVAWELVTIKRAYIVRRLDEENKMCIVEPPPRMHKDPILTDCLMTNDKRLYISGRLRRFLETSAIPDVTYQKVRVVDGTGLPLDDSYSILGFLNAPECLDLDASGAVRSRILPSKAEKLKRLDFKTDPGRPLFRPNEFQKITLIRWDLAESMAEEGFTGFRFMGLFDFGLHGDLPPHPDRYKIDALCSRLGKIRSI